MFGYDGCETSNLKLIDTFVGAKQNRQGGNQFKTFLLWQNHFQEIIQKIFRFIVRSKQCDRDKSIQIRIIISNMIGLENICVQSIN